MSLDDLSSEIESTAAAFDGELSVALDTETRLELAMLATALGPGETDELVRRGIHLLFQQAVETGKLDYLLRAGFDVTYDEYLSGMTFEEMTGGYQPTSDGNERRYQF